MKVPWSPGMHDNDTKIEERLDCLNRNVAKFRKDIRSIVHEEIQNVVQEALAKAVEELRKPRPYIEAGYRE
jgi:hypothetical protein